MKACPPLPASTIVAVIGGGPAGLMAAEALGADSSSQIHVFDAMPSPGRKFLMAGKGGMNITHAEAAAVFVERYGERQSSIAPLLEAFGQDQLREWIHGLGIETFVGSSGRVFPADMKAAPLLRAWLRRLRESGILFNVRHRWLDFAASEGRYELRFATPEGERRISADAVVFALGGGSWAKLGSDGKWVAGLEAAGIPIAPLRPANCGFDLHWSLHLRERFAGAPVKTVVAVTSDANGKEHRRQGEFIVTENGVEGGLIYALAAPLRDAIARNGRARLTLDLLPTHPLERVIDEVARPRGSRSLASHLQSRLGLKGVKVSLLHEVLAAVDFRDAEKLARTIKALPLDIIATRPLDEAISSAGGVLFEALDERLMLRSHPGIFCAGEMLDWEAPTGGYLLTACFSSGYAAGCGARQWLVERRVDSGINPEPNFSGPK